MRLVLDANTVVSGLAELQGVLLRPKFAGQLEARALQASEVFDGFAALATIIVPAIIAPVVIIDPADDAVLACALAAQADLIVSGDSDLLDLKNYHGMPIVSAAEAVERLSH